jgi:hypothetical protein
MILKWNEEKWWEKVSTIAERREFICKWEKSTRERDRDGDIFLIPNKL